MFCGERGPWWVAPITLDEARWLLWPLWLLLSMSTAHELSIETANGDLVESAELIWVF